MYVYIDEYVCKFLCKVCFSFFSLTNVIDATKRETNLTGTSLHIYIYKFRLKHVSISRSFSYMSVCLLGLLVGRLVGWFVVINFIVVFISNRYSDRKVGRYSYRYMRDFFCV